MLTKELHAELDKMDQMAAPLFAQIAQALYQMMPQLVEAYQADQGPAATENDADFLAWLSVTSEQNQFVFLWLVGQIFSVTLPGGDSDAG